MIPPSVKAKISVVSLGAVKLNDWYFKASSNAATGGICIVAFNPTSCHCQTRFFIEEEDAKLWINYMCMQRESDSTQL